MEWNVRKKQEIVLYTKEREATTIVYNIVVFFVHGNEKKIDADL